MCLIRVTVHVVVFCLFGFLLCVLSVGYAVELYRRVSSYVPGDASWEIVGLAMAINYM